MKPGPRVMEELRREVQGSLYPGCELVVAGNVGDSGIRRIVTEKYDILRSRFSESFLRKAATADLFVPEERQSDSPGTAFRFSFARKGRQSENVTIEKEAAALMLGDGGFLAGLWKMAESSDTGLFVDLRNVPIRQETIEICEYFSLNPYALFSGGTLLIGTNNGNGLIEGLVERGIPAAVIGHAKKGNDRILKSGTIKRYLDRPSPDEIGKILQETEKPFACSAGKGEEKWL